MTGSRLTASGPAVRRVPARDIPNCTTGNETGEGKEPASMWCVPLDVPQMCRGGRILERVVDSKYKAVGALPYDDARHAGAAVDLNAYARPE